MNTREQTRTGWVESRVMHPAVALESTLLAHGVPPESALPLHRRLCETVRARGANPALVAVIKGVPTVGLTDEELIDLLGADAAKLNTANLGVAMHRGATGATTVSTTVELAAAAGVRVFATGGLGGVHRGFAESLDISADLAALARFPVAVVSAGVKSLLDIPATREALETLGIPVIGFGTDEFPAFYSRSSGVMVDARFDDAADLAAYLADEMVRTGRGVLVGNPIGAEDEIPAKAVAAWIDEAHDAARAGGVGGRGVTPFVLSRLHERSAGRTLRANVELVVRNADLAARLALAMRGG